MDGLIGGCAVEVVGVLNGAGTADEMLTREDGMCGSPGFGSAFRQGISGGEAVEFLKGVVDLDAGFKAAADLLFKFSFKIPAYDEDDIAEASFDGVEYGVFDESLTVGTERIHLFETAIAAAHAGGHNNKSCFHLLLT